ncbi:MAG: cytochrome c biogenesis protein CcsA [Verrucomicrobiota bacterium]
MRAVIAVALFFCLTAGAARAQSEPLDFRQFGLLAIQDNGRRKPIDTFAQQTLVQLSGRSTYRDQTGRTWAGTDFLLSALLETHDWKNEPMILVARGSLIEELSLEKTRRRFSFAQLSQAAELQRLANEGRGLKRAGKELNRNQQEAVSVSDRLALFAHVTDGSALLIVPPAQDANAPWLVPEPATVSAAYGEQRTGPPMASLAATMRAFHDGDHFNFSTSARQTREGLRALNPAIYPPDSKLQLEYSYNHLDAFYRAIWCYGFGFLFLLLAHLSKRPWKGISIMGIMIALLALAFHATGIVMRCLIGGRPPVTNMYESIIWVSFAVSFFGMIFFARYRTPIYLLAALPVTLIALLLVHQMPIAMPASIDPLVPVLRDNFWLTIHVLTITLSYAAFALAMGFGHILLFRYARNPSETRADAPMHFWLYRVLQLGVLLLAAGTILGGVWANYSWGRFWGWDPKETWALIALLCYITTLHGRLAGWWTQFGLVVASVVCFLAVLMAWYGVNFVLGKGLHSYGFGIGGEGYVAAFVVVDLLFVSFAVIRYRGSRHATPAIAARELTTESASI